MSSVKTPDSKQPTPDWQKILSRLCFRSGQVASIAEVTPRQIDYWAHLGFLPFTTDTSGRRTFPIEAVAKAWTIARLLDEGYTLQAAAQRAAEFDYSIGLLRSEL